MPRVYNPLRTALNTQIKCAKPGIQRQSGGSLGPQVAPPLGSGRHHRPPWLLAGSWPAPFRPAPTWPPSASTCQAFGHKHKSVLIFDPWGAPAPQTPRVGGLPPSKHPAGTSGGGPGGSGGRKPPRERSTIANTGQRKATPMLRPQIKALLDGSTENPRCLR